MKHKECKFLRLLSAASGIGSCEATESDAVGLFFCQLEMEVVQDLSKPSVEYVCFRLRLKAGHEVVCEAKEISLAFTATYHTMAKPPVKRIMEIDIRQQRG